LTSTRRASRVLRGREQRGGRRATTVQSGEGAFNDTLEGNGGNNALVGGAGTDTISYGHAASGVIVSLAVTAAQTTSGGGTDTLSGFENLTGSAFSDVLTGSSLANVLMGLDGSDLLKGGGGADKL
jgi:Ca2+-binding RTX toxin-like protein